MKSPMDHSIPQRSKGWSLNIPHWQFSVKETILRSQEASRKKWHMNAWETGGNWTNNTKSQKTRERSFKLPEENLFSTMRAFNSLMALPVLSPVPGILRGPESSGQGVWPITLWYTCASIRLCDSGQRSDIISKVPSNTKMHEFCQVYKTTETPAQFYHRYLLRILHILSVCSIW